MGAVMNVIKILAETFKKLDFNLEYLGNGKVKISVIIDVDGDKDAV